MYQLNTNVCYTIKSKVTISRTNMTDSNIMTLAIIETENGQSMVIQQQQLLVYSKTNHIVKIFAVMRGTNEKPKWELEFQLKGEKERALLVTSLNKPRQFPRLNNMVELVKEWCPYIENIVLDIHLDQSNS